MYICVTQHCHVLANYLQNLEFLWFMGTLSGEGTQLITYLLPVSREVYFQMKEFAPFGANSFL